MTASASDRPVERWSAMDDEAGGITLCDEPVGEACPVGAGCFRGSAVTRSAGTLTC